MANFLTGRCNFSGHETGGPKHMLGGLFGPEHEGRHKWVCENPAQHRVKMYCKLYGHEGPVMTICTPHFGEIQKRMAGLCTRCAYPPEARSVEEEIRSHQWNLQALVDARWAWDDPKCAAERRAIEAGRVRMDELWQSGRIKVVPMKLVEVA